MKLKKNENNINLYRILVYSKTIITFKSFFTQHGFIYIDTSLGDNKYKYTLSYFHIYLFMKSFQKEGRQRDISIKYLDQKKKGMIKANKNKIKVF